MLKESTTSALTHFCNISLEMFTSVVTKPNMVHIFGWIMPEPLHIPPNVTVLPPISVSMAIALEMVSVVMMACAASEPASKVSALAVTSFLIPAVILSTGICIPMTPVDATSTASVGTPNSSPAHFASASQQSSPCLPVQALAIPELTTTACANAECSTICLSHSTGAAFTTLEVNVPATVQGALLTISAISLRF